MNINIVFVVILAVRGVIISDFMSRNPTYDNMATLSTDIISTLILGCPVRCASHCTRNDKCKSIMFNMDTHVCQLVSVHMSDTGPQSYTGWLYYEKIIDDAMSTTHTADAVTTKVSTGVTQSTFDGMMPITDTVDVKTTAQHSTETTQTTFDSSIWHQHLGHWYLLDTNYRTFSDSRSFCASLSPTSYVTEVDTQAENDWLIGLTLPNGGESARYWLNGYDTDNSGTFTWIESQTPASYTNWYPGEPNDFFGPSEICITLMPGNMEGWHDVPCSMTFPVVCERDS